jgi:hypothetical protein
VLLTCSNEEARALKNAILVALHQKGGDERTRVVLRDVGVNQLYATQALDILGRAIDNDGEGGDSGVGADSVDDVHDDAGDGSGDDGAGGGGDEKQDVGEDEEVGWSEDEIDLS